MAAFAELAAICTLLAEGLDEKLKKLRAERAKREAAERAEEEALTQKFLAMARKIFGRFLPSQYRGYAACPPARAKAGPP